MVSIAICISLEGVCGSAVPFLQSYGWFVRESAVAVLLLFVTRSGKIASHDQCEGARGWHATVELPSVQMI